MSAEQVALRLVRPPKVGNTVKTALFAVFTVFRHESMRILLHGAPCNEAGVRFLRKPYTRTTRRTPFQGVLRQSVEKVQVFYDSTLNCTNPSVRFFF